MPIINQVVSGGGGSSVAEPYLEFSINENGALIHSITTNRVIDLTGVTLLSLTNILNSAYYNNTNIQGVINFPDLARVTGTAALSNCFCGCSGITGVILQKLTEIIAQNGCFGTFDSAINITSAKMDLLTTVSGQNGMAYMFKNTKLTEFRFCSLNNISGNQCLNSLFNNCQSLVGVWFYALNINSFGTQTNQFGAMLSGVTGCTVHFPMAIQSTIGSWSDVTNGFGGTNTTVLFDLVTSLTGADSNTYTRQEKDSTSTATAWVYNDTLYYTSGVSDNDHGVNEPAVSDTIYSDAACTQSVTTITAIA